jgi:hypothetical protein
LQLSDASGNFGNAIILGTLTSTANSGSISGTIPEVATTIMPLPNAPSIAGNTSCAGLNTTLSIANPTANTTYLRSNGATGNSITVSASGTYSVTYNSEGCNSLVSNTITVTVNPLPMAMITQIGNVLSVMEVPNATYQWLLGRTIHKETIVSKLTPLELPKGIYFLQINSREGVATKQVVEQ